MNKLRLALIALSLLALAFGPRPDQGPLLRAAGEGNMKRLVALYRAHADLFERDGNGRTGLIVGTMAKRPNVVQFFLEAKADVDARDVYGFSALHYAAQIGDVAAVKVLLAAGANPELYSKQCLAPADLAAIYGLPGVFAELRRVKATLPKDGTTEECGLKGARPANLEANRVLAHKRLLTITTVEDYEFALESLRLIRKDPKLGRKLTDAMIGLVDHSSPNGAEEYQVYDAMVREQAAKTLTAVVTNRSDQAQVASRLMKMVEGGGCSGFTAKSCDKETVDTCKKPYTLDSVTAGLRFIVTGKRSQFWPRSEAKELCFNCLHCQETRIGNGFHAALTWFAANKEFSAEAQAALARLAKNHVLSPTEARRLKQGRVAH